MAMRNSGFAYGVMQGKFAEMAQAFAQKIDGLEDAKGKEYFNRMLAQDKEGMTDKYIDDLYKVASRRLQRAPAPEEAPVAEAAA
jgi:hypothetical protein